MPNALFSAGEAPMVALAFREALDAALDMLVDQQGFKPGTGLDQVELDAVSRVKTLIGEGTPTRAETAMIELGVLAVKAVFAAYRKQLAEAATHPPGIPEVRSITSDRTG